MQLAKHEQFPGAIRQAAQRTANHGGGISAEEQGFRIGRWAFARMVLFVERICRLPPLAAPAVAGVANDAEEPGAPLPPLNVRK